MTTGMVGADVAELRSLVQLFESSAGRLRTIAASVKNGIQISVWVGPFAARFRMTWDSEHSVRLRSAADMLEHQANVLRRNADEQEQASKGGSGGTVTAAYQTSGDDHGSMAAPTGAKDLYTTIRDAEASDDGVRIQVIKGEDGVDRYMVYLDGTRGVGPDSFDPTRQRTWWDNAVGIKGDTGVTEAHILQVMKDAGIPLDADVALVGYSQGGIHAQNIASLGIYHVTDVVTYGSPVVPNAVANAFGANVLNIRDPRDPVPYSSVFGLEPRPDGVARAVVAAFNPAAGDVQTYLGISDTQGTPLDVHTERSTYEQLGGEFDNSADPRFSDIKESLDRYQGTIVSDTNDD